MRTTSYIGLCCIAHEEAYCRLAYVDGVLYNRTTTSTGKPLYSQGIGHSSHDLGPHSPPMEIEEAWALFKADVANFDKWLDEHLKVTSKQHEWDGAVSCLFNRGAMRFNPVVMEWNRSGLSKALALMMGLCVTSAGKFSIPLAKRRLREVEIMTAATYPDPFPLLRFDGDPRTTQGVPIHYPPA